MKIVTGNEMREIDRIAIEERNIPSPDLMERAGQSVANLIIGQVYPRSVAVVTGKGNNAGDGFVTARYLHEAGVHVILVMLAKEDQLSGEALINYNRLSPQIPRFICVMENQVAMNLEGIDCVVDAIMGTGVQGDLRGLYAGAVKAINNCKATIVSVDIPSGLPADVEHFDGLCIRADYTVTMGLPKLGMTQYPAAGYCGKVSVAWLGFPDDLLKEESPSKCSMISHERIKKILPQRPPDGHKGTFGSVLVVGGSIGMTGAVSMTALSAARSGAGLVFAAIPHSLNTILEIKLTEPITIPLPTDSQGVPDKGMLDGILENASKCDAVALGPGMGRDAETFELIRECIEKISQPLVLDADGLNALEGHMDILKNRKAPTIVTPHPGEFSRMIGQPVSEIIHKRISLSRAFAMDHEVWLVLKGASTIVAEPGGRININSTGNNALAKGGSGDILTGLIAGFLAQGKSPEDSAILGVFIHGAAGEHASHLNTEYACIPTDVIRNISKAFLDFNNNDER